MFCVNCGTQLPDDANFCLKCGRPCRTEPQAAITVEDKWEECVIEYEVVREGFLYRGDDLKFVARAIRPEGEEYTVAESPAFRVSPLYSLPSRDDREILNQLIEKLISEGWEKTGRRNSDFYWEYTFRRKSSG